MASVVDKTTEAIGATPVPVVPISASSTTRLPTRFEELLGDNPYFQAGFGLLGVGFGLTVLRQGVVVGSSALRRRLLVTLEINNKDKSYDWFLAWMAHSAPPISIAEPGQPRVPRRLPWFRSHELSVETTVEQRSNGSSSVFFKLVAGPGVHWFKYRGAWMQVRREREIRSTHIMSGVPWETVTVTALSRDRVLFPSLLADARDLALKGLEGKLVLLTAWGTEWRPFGQPRRKRPLDSVVLADGVRERIEGDVKAFLGRRAWYADRGIPYRRGYLLHGPPGSGKSSFIQALAGSLSYDICLLNLSERGLGDDKLNYLLSNAPERSFILIEDIDAAFNKRAQTSEDGYQSSITFSGFLNALDGVASGEERIIFMTTNHLSKLDAALIRPGRVDVMEFVDDATPAQAHKLFTRFYGGDMSGNNHNAVNELGAELASLVSEGRENDKRISMAALQGLFIRNGPQEAVASCRQLSRPRT